MDTLATLSTRRTDSYYGYDDYDYYDDYVMSATGFAGAGIWMLISLVIAVIGGVVAYFLFVKSPKVNPANRFLAWLKKFWSFDIMWIEDMLKIFYIICTIAITLGSFSFLSAGGPGFLVFLLTELLGNFLIRIVYEAALVRIMIWRNTTDIKSSLKEKK